MLVLSREINQSLMIGPDMELQVLKLRGQGANLRVTRRLIGGRMTEEVFSGWLQKDQKAVLENNIFCVVLAVGGYPTNVRIGIEAPRELSIHRKEVYDAIRRTQQ